MSINLFLQSADRSAPVAASPEGPRGSVESAEGSLCPHLQPTETQHWSFWTVLGRGHSGFEVIHPSAGCDLWVTPMAGDTRAPLSAPQMMSPVSTHVSWDALTAHNALPDRINRDFFSHCQEITPFPCARYRWNGGEKMHVHVHVASKSPLCPGQVLRMALCVWGASCAESWPWPCGLLTSSLVSAEGTL